MVLFKRKPVRYLEDPVIEDENQEVFVMKMTGEIFTDYEKYLERLDFYNARRFICQITGHSGLNFFEALKSEQAGGAEVEQQFPVALKGPILRRVQHQTISRIDNLVDLIYDEFKKDYYPGEAVTVHVVSGERLAGVVRAKTRFGSKILPNGHTSPAFSRYFVSLDDRPFEEAVVDDDHITRDRKIFTKQVLRAFIKKTVTREAHFNAPWCVKPEVAELYHIDTRIPAHLRHENQVAERRQKLAMKKQGGAFDDMVGVFPGPKPQLPELKPAPKSHKSKQLQTELAKSKKPMSLNSGPTQMGPPNFHQHMPPPQYHGPIFHQNGHYLPQHMPPPQGPPPPGMQIQYYNNQSPYPPPQQMQQQQQQYQAAPAAPPPPPPIKYPIPDLEVVMRTDDSVKSLKRPTMKFFSEDTPVPVDENPAKGSGIKMETVGQLLETWDTLNVYCEVFVLDSFTFDDYVEALQIASEDEEVELFTEIHCSALKLLVTPEGEVNIELPETEEEDDEDEENDTSAMPTPTPEPEPPKKRATRSSMAKAEAEALKAPAKSPTPEVKKTNMAAEMSATENWIEKLAKRDFKNGGWEFIVVCLLYQLTGFARYEKKCEEVLNYLAPLDMEPTQETARVRYGSMDINLRVRALQIVCMLTSETKHFRAYMEECAESMTKSRKEKIECQRERKAAIEDLRLLNEEKRALLPKDTNGDSKENAKTETNGDVEMAEVPAEEESASDSDEEPTSRSLRRGTDRALERQKKRDVAATQKAEAAALAAKGPKHSKQYLKLLKDIAKKQEIIKENEEKIKVIDNDLREADCPRTRVLGKDRFWNRYWWFERNGMPYAGLPDSSTSEAGYANGCLWIQGPDDIEREGFIDLKKEWQDEYKSKIGMTVPERKKVEEGKTSVFNAWQWGYYDSPEAIDELLTWLDMRGQNELKLRKELLAYSDKIKLHMEKRKEYLKGEEEKRLEDMQRRSSSRKAVRTEEYGCLKWHNLYAMQELGHLHSDQPRTRKKVLKKDAEVEIASRAKGGKPLGRQGTSYNFKGKY